MQEFLARFWLQFLCWHRLLPSGPRILPTGSRPWMSSSCKPPPIRKFLPTERKSFTCAASPTPPPHHHPHPPPHTPTTPPNPPPYHTPKTPQPTHPPTTHTPNHPQPP